MAKQFLYYIRHPQKLSERNKYVFLLSHMRGYTSLLGHILGSQPQIKGYSEMHQSYRHWLDLLTLRYKVKITTSRADTPKYLFDKILHNKYKLKKNIMLNPNVYPLIMIRRPEKTLQSIVSMGKRHVRYVRWYQIPDRVTQYYVQRLSDLEKKAILANGKCFFILAEDLLDNTSRTLQELTRYLRLEYPISEEYQTFGYTGMHGFGDPSAAIKKGKIIRNKKKPETPFPSNLIIQAQRAYDRSILNLKKYCITAK